MESVYTTFFILVSSPTRRSWRVDYQENGSLLCNLGFMARRHATEGVHNCRIVELMAVRDFRVSIRYDRNLAFQPGEQEAFQISRWSHEVNSPFQPKLHTQTSLCIRQEVEESCGLLFFPTRGILAVV